VYVSTKVERGAYCDDSDLALDFELDVRVFCRHGVMYLLFCNSNVGSMIETRD
jgi:hypothetical protein